MQFAIKFERVKLPNQTQMLRNELFPSQQPDRIKLKVNNTQIQIHAVYALNKPLQKRQ